MTKRVSYTEFFIRVRNDQPVTVKFGLVSLLTSPAIILDDPRQSEVMRFITILLPSILLALSSANAAVKQQPMVCDGKGNCQTEADYQAYLNSPDYYCQYYARYIWKESERAYGKKQYAYTDDSLNKIKSLKDEGISLCNTGNRSKGEEKLRQAIKIISFTPPAR